MCGIVGSTTNLLHNPDKQIKHMTQMMRHRGPDAQCVYVNKDIAFGHARLSIIDLSDSANQPFLSDDKRYVIVFNGEIYNFLDLKKELQHKGFIFRTSSDTEVLLKLYQSEGVDCLQKLRGMFAFAIWDTKEKTMFLANDRIGKKPLYFFYEQAKLAFASELKALMVNSKISRDVDDSAVADFLKYAYIPYPKTIYKNIYKLKPGHFLMYGNGELSEKAYWDIDFAKPLNSSEEDIKEELFDLIQESTKYRMIADVPLGAFLSGGIDSSAVVGLMAGLSKEPVKTCTIGFKEGSFNESLVSKKTAEFFNTDHHEYILERIDTDHLRKLVWHFDEPFADSSFIPTYHVSKTARQIVTVALSGDGGDENFGGYQKYLVDQQENKFRTFLPRPMVLLLSAIFKSEEWFLSKKVRSLTNAILMDPAYAFYNTNSTITDAKYNALLSDSFRKKIKDYSPAEQTLHYYHSAQTDDHFSRILYTDLKTYLPGDILVKTDRMSMANSLELRSPLLDHKVIEFAAKIPSYYKIKNRTKKHILKETFRALLPDFLINLPKHGFELPLRNILITKINHLVEEYVLQKLYLEEFFSKAYIKNYWATFKENKLTDGYLIWQLLVFSLWYDIFMEGNDL
jgi:asparagine synthase (glutamine-hydrolysing)